MKSILFISMLLLCVLIFDVLSADAGQIATISGSSTSIVKNDLLNSYQSKTVYFDRNKMQLYVLGTSSLASKDRKQNKAIWIWKLNTINGTILETELNSIQKDTIKIFDIQCIQNANNGNMIAVVTAEDGRPFLVSIGIDGEIKIINILASGRNVTKIIVTTDSKLILIGRQSQKSFVMKLTDAGVEEWSKVFDRGQTETFVDGFATNDGGFILTENSGKFEPFFMGESSLFVTKFDVNGLKIDERYLPGRYGYIAKGSAGSFAVVYDKKADSSQEIWVQAYDKDLSPLWNQKITDIKFGLERFKIASLANGNYVIVGTVIGKPWVTYLDSGGVKKWDYLSTSQDFENSIDIVANGDDAYMVSTVIRLNTDKALNNKIKLIKFKPE